MDYKNTLKLFSKNFLYGGILLGVLITIIDLIKDSNHSVNFYAYASASFFLINLFQYYYIAKLNPKLEVNFLFHTMIGGIIFSLYAILMFILFKYNFSTYNNILFTGIIYIIITAIYFYLAVTKQITI